MSDLGSIGDLSVDVTVSITDALAKMAAVGAAMRTAQTAASTSTGRIATDVARNMALAGASAAAMATATTAAGDKIAATVDQVRVNLAALAAQGVQAKIGVDAAPFWAGVAALRSEVGAMSSLDINVDANIALATAKISALKGQLAMLSVDSTLASLAGGGTSAAAGAGGGGAAGGKSIASLLGFGGLFGLAGMGSLGALAGFGPEHVILTGLGLAGSAAGATAGAGLLGAGALGTMAVGGGSDLAVAKSTIADTSALYANYTALQAAIQQYGAASTQAAAATTTLNQTMATLGNTAGVTAELQLAKAASAMNAFWDQVSSGARVALVNIALPFLALGTIYLPLISNAAQTNFGIILTALQPLLAFLQGPMIGIFNNLESVFAQNLPASMNIFVQGFEFIAKTVDFASGYIGGFTQKISELITYLNSPPEFQRWEVEIGNLIGLFHTWADFIVTLGKTLYLVFSQTLGLGTGIIKSLTGMLKGLNDYLSSATGKASLHTLFQAHLDEILQILKLVPLLIQTLGPVYLTVAPALTNLVTLLLGLILHVTNFLTHMQGGLGTLAKWAIGLALIEALGSPVAGALGLIKTAATALSGVKIALFGAEAPTDAAATVGAITKVKNAFVGLQTFMVGGAVTNAAGQAMADTSGTPLMKTGAIEAVGNAFRSVATAVGRYSLMLVGLVGDLVVATAAQVGLDIAMDTNIVGLIVLGIAALVAGIILLVTHWKQVTAALGVVWDAMKAFAAWIGGEWMKTFAPVGEAIDKVFAGIGPAIGNAANTAIQALNAVISAYDKLAGVLGMPRIATITFRFNQPAPLVIPAPTTAPVPGAAASPGSPGYTSAGQTAPPPPPPAASPGSPGYTATGARGLPSPSAAPAQSSTFILTGLLSAVNAVVAAVGKAFSQIGSIVDAIVGVFQKSLPVIVRIAQVTFAVLFGMWIVTMRALWSAVQPIWNAIADFLRMIWNSVLVPAARAAFFLLQLLIIQPMTAIWHGIQQIWNTINQDVLQPAWDWIKATAGPVFQSVYTDDIEPPLVAIRNLFTTIWDDITKGTGAGWSAIEGAVAGGVNDVIQVLDTFIEATNSALGAFGLPPIAIIGAVGVAGGGGAGKAPGKGGPVHSETGGMIPGVGGRDTVPALLTPGEGVLTKSTVAGLGGAPAIAALNAQHFANGGIVGSIGGQCEVWVENVTGHHFATADAAEMVEFINSHTPKIGEIFVSTIPPFGHTGIINGPNSVIDSNWVAPLTVGVHCVAEGTLISTECGLVPIEEVQVGDCVWTRQGLKPVTWSGLTRPDAELLRITADGHEVMVTPDHRVWVENADALPPPPSLDHPLRFEDSDCMGDVRVVRMQEQRQLIALRQDGPCAVTVADEVAEATSYRSIFGRIHPVSAAGGGIADAANGLAVRSDLLLVPFGADEARVGAHLPSNIQHLHGTVAPTLTEPRQKSLRDFDDACCVVEVPSVARTTPSPLWEIEATTATYDLLEPLDDVQVVHREKHLRAFGCVAERPGALTFENAGGPGDLFRGGFPKSPTAFALHDPYHTDVRWVHAENVRLGDSMLMFTGTEFVAAQITAVEPMARIDAYDIEVQDAHEFVAGGLLVANSLSGIPDIAGYIDLGKGLPSGLTGTAGAGLDPMGILQGLLGAANLGSVPSWLGNLPKDIISDSLSGIAKATMTGVNTAASWVGSDVKAAASAITGLGARGYDSGGLLQPGISTVFNGTGKPETVRTAAQEAALSGGNMAGTNAILTMILTALQANVARRPAPAATTRARFG